MQALLAVIIATALMLSAYNPKQTNKRIAPRRHLNNPSRRNSRQEKDSLKIYPADTVVLMFPVQSTTLPGIAYLASTVD